MTRYVALLRGINVGGRRTVPMSALRDAFEALGFAEVSTYIQSGNVLFSSDGQVSPPELQAALADRFDLDIDVMVRTSSDLQAIVAACPFPVSDTKLLHVGFMAHPPDPANVQRLDLEPFAPDTAEVRGTEIYFSLPNGMGRTKLAGYVDRRLAVPTTIRNWNTTAKLLELSS